MGNSHNNVAVAVASGSGEEDSDGVRTGLKGSSCESAVRVTFEFFGEVAELEDGVVESEDTELSGIVLADEGGGREGRTEEVVTFAALLGEGDQEDGQKYAIHTIFI